MSLSVALNVLALSERNLLGSPLLAAKRKLKMYCVDDTTCKESYPNFTTALVSFLDIDGASKVNSSVQKRWGFLDTERGKWW